MALTDTQRGFISVFGGFTLHLVMGSIFMWGTLNVYVTSYFRQLNDEGLSLSLGGAIFPVMMACVATGMPIGLKLAKYFGSTRYFCMGASIVCAALVFASSYAQKFWQYVLIYGVGYGLVSGTNYFTPIYLGYLYFPKKKGFVSGTILGGYGLCSLVFGLTFTAFVNPDKLDQQKNSDGFSYYEGESVSVAEEVPFVLRKMSYIYLAVSVLGCCFLMDYPDQISQEKQKQNEQVTEKITVELNCINDDKEAINQQNEDLTSKCKSDKLKDYDLAGDKDIDAIVQNSDNLLSIKKISPMEQTQNSYNNHKNNNNNEDEEKEEINDNRIESENNNGSDPSLQKPPSSPNKKKHENKIVLQEEMQLESANEVNKTQDNEKRTETQNKLQIDVAKIDKLDSLGAPTLKLAFSQQQLYMSFILAYLAIGFGVIVNGNYKSIAKDYGFNNEEYLNLVGALVSTANGISRIFWACLLDRFNFKQILQAILLVQIIFSLTIRLSSAHEVFYIIWVFVINATFGGVLGIWPAFSASLNGIKIGSQIYGLYWYSFSLANFTQFLFVNYLKKSMGFNNIFYIYTGMAAAAFIFLCSYQFRIKWSKYYLKEEQRVETEQQLLKDKPQPQLQP